MSIAAPFLDAVLVITLLALAGAVLVARDIHRAVMMFVAFGLLMALVWARLHAVDIALAEAAIGAGLTGALLLGAVRGERPDPSGGAIAAVAAAALCATLAGALLWAVHGAGEPGGAGLREAALARLDGLGLGNPTTAVLLVYRAYDTLLELAVLALVVSAVRALPALDAPGSATSAPSPALAALLRLVAPLGVALGVYLLWAGTDRPGGAFQAGAVLAGTAALLALAGQPLWAWPRLGAYRALTVLGVAVFVLAGTYPLAGGGAFLAYPAPVSGWVLAIETAATLTIATALTAALLGRTDASPGAPR